MKPTRRLFAILLVLAMLLTNSGMTALAEAVLNMPAALQIIDEEAFYGSTSIDKVVLPNNVTEIRARAFANSTLSEINLPDSITYIDDTAFDGPSKVTLLVNEGSYAYTWAVRNNYIRAVTSVALNKSSASLQVGDTIALIATVVPANTTDDVIWASSDPYVINVDDQGNALATGVGTTSITVTAGSYSASCNVNVAKKQQQLTISSITAGQSEGLTAGDVLAWSVEITGADGVVSYSYTLMRDGQQISQTLDTPFNTYQTIADKEGTYQLRVECSDSFNSTTMISEPVVAAEVPFTVECLLENSTDLYVGDTINVSAIASETNVSLVTAQ